MPRESGQEDARILEQSCSRRLERRKQQSQKQNLAYAWHVPPHPCPLPQGEPFAGSSRRRTLQAHDDEAGFGASASSSLLCGCVCEADLVSRCSVALAQALGPKPKAIKVEIDHRRCIKRQHLAHDETANNRDPERPS